MSGDAKALTVGKVAKRLLLVHCPREHNLSIDTGWKQLHPFKVGPRVAISRRGIEDFVERESCYSYADEENEGLLESSVTNGFRSNSPAVNLLSPLASKARLEFQCPAPTTSC